jgi:hypothetical protein
MQTLNKLSSHQKNTFSGYHEFASTQSFDFSERTTSGKNNTSNFHYQFSSQNLFNRSNKVPSSHMYQNYNYNMNNKQFSTPFNNSNIHYSNVNNYSNLQYRPTIGQNSFSIEPWQSKKHFKENVNNRSISQMNNMNLNCIMNYQSEEKYILDNIDKLLTDQNGCRILQKKLDEKNKEFMYLFFETIKNKLSFIINNQFGNYLMQKFIECSLLIDVSYLTSLISLIKNNLLEHANDPYGSRVIQKLLDLLNSNSNNSNSTNITNKIYAQSSQSLSTICQFSSQHQVIIDTLIDFARINILSLIIDTNGNHVLQKILMLSKKYGSSVVIDEVIKHAIEIAKMKQGASVIQKALEVGLDMHKVS